MNLSILFSRALQIRVSLGHEAQELVHPDFCKLLTSVQAFASVVESRVIPIERDIEVTIGGSLVSATLLRGDTPDVNIQVLIPSDDRDLVHLLSTRISDLLPVHDLPEDHVGVSGSQARKFHKGQIEYFDTPFVSKIMIRPKEGYVGLGALLAAMPYPFIETYIVEKATYKNRDKEEYRSYKLAVYSLLQYLYDNEVIDHDGILNSERYNEIVRIHDAPQGFLAPNQQHTASRIGLDFTGDKL
jgi:hypothetical protein